MRPSLPVRLLAILLVWVPATVAVWIYVSTHDLVGSWHQLQTGRKVTWPPAPKQGPRSAPISSAQHVLDDVASVLKPVALGLMLLICIVGVSRALSRRKRARATMRWELRLGRDDLANPYRVQEAFEGIAGAISVRWQQRIWSGPDHFALEVHRLPDQSIRFTVAAPRHVKPAIKAPLEDLYPDVELVEVTGEPTWGHCIVRLKKRSAFVLSIQTTRDYEHAFSESLVALLSSHEADTTVQLVLTPAPGFVHRRARHLLKRRERVLLHAEKQDPTELGTDSVIEAKELKGALELQHRSLLYFDLRVAGNDARAVARTAGLFSQLRSENEFARRRMRTRRRVYARRLTRAAPNPIPGITRQVLSTSELATLWQLPRARVKHARLPRATVRRAIAPPEVNRDRHRTLLQDERGPVAIDPEDRKYGHALVGGQGGGKSSVLARHFANDVNDPERVVVLIDPKGPLAELCLGLVPDTRTVHYLDLGHPEIGFNPLDIDATPGARAAVFLHALIDANPPGAIQAASDSFLRQAVTAVCTVERRPTLWHVYRMLDFGPSAYRDDVLRRLDTVPGADFARRYWRREFAALVADRRFAAQALNPPRNKLERLISTHEIDTLLRHPIAIDLEGILKRGDVLIVAGAKGTVGEDNTILVTQLLLQLLHRALQTQQRLDTSNLRRVSLLIDEAHNVLTQSVARLLAEGRSAGLEAVFAWQFSGQICDEGVRSGVRSLLQSISVFRMREMEDARSLTGLAMEVYSDRIGVEQDDQERLRFSADDIVRLPAHHAINLWVANGTPRAGFLARTLPMEPLYTQSVADHHRDRQRLRGGHHPSYLPDPCADIGVPEGEVAPGGDGHRQRRTRRKRSDTAASPQLPLTLSDDVDVLST